jgi:hypothetical protein
VIVGSGTSVTVVPVTWNELVKTCEFEVWTDKECVVNTTVLELSVGLAEAPIRMLEKACESRREMKACVCG